MPAADCLERLGDVPYAELLEILHRVDVAVIPFRDTHHTRVVESVKVCEYLAACKQVVASRLPPLERHSWPLRFATTPGESFVQLDAAVAAGPDCPAARRFVQDHTWQHRFQELSGALTPLVMEKRRSV